MAFESISRRTQGLRFARGRLVDVRRRGGLITLVLLIPVVGIAALAAIAILAPGSVVESGLGHDSAWLVHRLRRGKVTAPPAA